MCRLFLQFHIDNDHSIYIKRFLKQGHKKYQKHTPGLTNYRDNGPHTEGFGFASLKANANRKADANRKAGAWVIYKSHERSTFDLDRIPKRAKLVIGHLRKRCDRTTVSIENTHPFVYKDHVFLHNGRIRDFDQYRSMILGWIHPRFRNLIEGQTDTEHLFYFYLTIAETHNPVESFRILFQTFATYDIELSANIIYANPDTVVITRFLYYNTGEYKRVQHPHSLYYDATDGFIVSSEPVSGHPRIVPENSMIEIDIKSGEARMISI